MNRLCAILCCFVLVLLQLSCGLSLGGKQNIKLTASFDGATSPEQQLEVKNIIKSRLSKLGAKNVDLTLEKDELSIALFAEVDTSLIRLLVETKGKLMLLETYNNIDLYDSFFRVNQLIVDSTSLFEQLIARDYTFNEEEEELFKRYPLFHFFVLNVYSSGKPANSPIIGFAFVRNTDRVCQLLLHPAAKHFFPEKFSIMRKKKEDRDKELVMYELVAVKQPDSNDYSISNNNIEKVEIKNNGFELLVKLKKEYHQTWEDMTKASIGSSIAIALDEEVYFAPHVVNKISGGIFTISGLSSGNDEAKVVSSILENEPLPAPLKVTSIELININQPK